MGIFSRLRDIIHSNINAMLDKAEDPEKLLRLMIAEMEDTLVEIKAQCAAAMAQSKAFLRQIEELGQRAGQWAGKARLAVEKGREDLAREALLQKRSFQERAEPIEQQHRECDGLIEKYRQDIAQLEAKIQSVRERQKLLAHRHAHAQIKRRAEQSIRQANGGDVLARFDSFERRVDHMEAEADLVNAGRSKGEPSLDARFRDLEGDEALEKELAALREQVGGKPGEQK